MVASCRPAPPMPAIETRAHVRAASPRLAGADAATCGFSTIASIPYVAHPSPDVARPRSAARSGVTLRSEPQHSILCLDGGKETAARSTFNYGRDLESQMWAIARRNKRRKRRLRICASALTRKPHDVRLWRACQRERDFFCEFFVGERLAENVGIVDARQGAAVGETGGK